MSCTYEFIDSFLLYLLYPTVPSISHTPVVTLTRRNLKRVSSAAFCAAINVYKLAEVFYLDDVDAVHDIIISELVRAMDQVAPCKQIHTRRRPTPLYLAPDTRAVMAARDRAAVSGSTDYRTLRNRANHLVRRDKHKSAEDFIASTTSSGWPPSFGALQILSSAHPLHPFLPPW